MALTAQSFIQHKLRLLFSLVCMGLFCCPSCFGFSPQHSSFVHFDKAPPVLLASSKDTEMPDVTSTGIHTTSGNCIRNFRAAAGLCNVYRCAKTDGLGSRLSAPHDEWSDAERLILEQAGLILDLRSDSERDEELSQAWMSQAPGGKFVVYRNEFPLPPPTDSKTDASRQRAVLRLDPLSPKQFMAYLESNWLSATEKLQATMFKIVDGQQLHNLRIGVLNQKGLVGLNEAILETGKKDMLAALQAMTVHLEQNPDDPVVIHCVQGKDRTGLLVMLCQSILGLSDEEIITDYNLSEQMMEGSAALAHTMSKRQAGKIDKTIFGGAPREVMVTTLAWVRSTYGSISPGYLNAIGFDESWRLRLSSTLQPSQLKSRL